MTRVLVVGASGQVGRELARAAWPAGFEVEALGRAELELSAPEAVQRALGHRPMDVLINAAAYTNVDRAEAEPELAHRVNAEAPGWLGDAARSAGAPLIHLSTDYVFDGKREGSWREDDPIGPLGTYARTKAEGEARVRATQPWHAIVRTSWVYSPFGHNFVKTMLRLGREREELRVVGDQWGAPTSAAEIARALVRVTQGLLARGASVAGTYHFSAEGRVSWAGFAEAIFEEAADMLGRKPRVVPIPAAEWPSPVIRPMNSVLNCDRIQRVFSVERRPWRAPLAGVIREIASEEAGP